MSHHVLESNAESHAADGIHQCGMLCIKAAHLVNDGGIPMFRVCSNLLYLSRR
jgi:hypothetical protein